MNGCCNILLRCEGLHISSTETSAPTWSILSSSDSGKPTVFSELYTSEPATAAHTDSMIDQVTANASRSDAFTGNIGM